MEAGVKSQQGPRCQLSGPRAPCPAHPFWATFMCPALHGPPGRYRVAALTPFPGWVSLQATCPPKASVSPPVKWDHTRFSSQVWGRWRLSGRGSLWAGRAPSFHPELQVTGVGSGSRLFSVCHPVPYPGLLVVVVKAPSCSPSPRFLKGSSRWPAGPGHGW